MEIIIDQEFKDLIPPLSEDEKEQLETNIIGDGIRDPLVTWNGILIDGHNRYEIASEHGIEFDVTEIEFGSREEAKIWIIQNQLGRRNLSAYDRTKLALKLKPEIQGRTPNTRDALAEIAGVSTNTVHKVEYIESNATDETKEKLDNGEISINRAYQELRPAESISFKEIKGSPEEQREEILARLPERESRLGLPYQKIASDAISCLVKGDLGGAVKCVLELLEDPTPTTMALAKIILNASRE